MMARHPRWRVHVEFMGCPVMEPQHPLQSTPTVLRKSLTAAAAAAVLCASSLVLPVTAGGETDQDRRDAERAADAIAAAQSEANSAAQAWADAQSEYDQLSVELVDLEAQQAASQAKVDGL